jgi:hypothetical protein
MYKTYANTEGKLMAKLMEFPRQQEYSKGYLIHGRLGGLISSTLLQRV